MAEIASVSVAGYRFLRGVFQYSAGVAAEPGFEIERARFLRPLPLDDAFRAIEAHLQRIGRPRVSLCACELRSPAPFTEEGFAAFNRAYVGTLERWGIVGGHGNPVARANVCSEIDPPPTPTFYAFAYTIPARAEGGASFHIAGSGEVPEGKGNYRDHLSVPRRRTRPKRGNGGRAHVAFRTTADRRSGL